MSENPEAPTLVDPPPGAARQPIRTPGFKLKKLVKDVPGGIRMVNKAGSALSAGTRAVEFIDGGEIQGLPEEEALEMESIIEQFGALNDGQSPTAVELLNMYCESRANRTVAEIYPFADPEGLTHLLVFIDVFLSGEELDDYEQANADLSAIMDEKKAKRAADKAKAEEAKAAEERQKAEDLALGKTAREQNLVGKLRDLEDTVKRIRKAGNKLAQQAGVKDWLKEESDAP